MSGMRPQYQKQAAMMQKGNRAAAFAAVNMGELDKLNPGLIARCHGMPVAAIEEMIAERKARPSIWDSLETPLHEEAIFPVQAPDGRKDLSELDRQGWLVSYIHQHQSHIRVWATPNAAKRGFKAQAQAKKEGLLAGVFDLTFAWDVESATKDMPQTICWAEMKGYDSSGRAGKLSQEQIDWGNSMHRKGFKVACFYSAKSVLEWLADLGAPIRGRISA